MEKIHYLKDLDLKNKRVFLRADLNVPIDNKEIMQDYRLKGILPTIKYIQEHGGKVILATHIGRPEAAKETNYFDKKLSTQILIPWFEKNNFKIKLERDLIDAEAESHKDFDQILMLENLRFFNGEKGDVKERSRLAQLLYNTADIHINDAFGLTHRKDCSVTDLPKLFEPSKQGFGLLIEKEIKALNKLKEEAKQPFLLILGGNKIEDKIKILDNFLKQPKANRIQTILIGGKVDESFVKDFLEFAKKEEINIFLPEDYIKIDGIPVDIGPKTIKTFENVIKTAKTIFVNGSMGIYEKPESAEGTKAILKAICASDAYTVAGGGDCVAAIYKFGLQDKFDFLSTGGGATLAYLGN